MGGGFFCVCRFLIFGGYEMNNASLQENVLSRKQAAEFLGVCRTTLDRMNLPRTKVRRRVLYRQSVLIQWLERNTENKGVYK